VLSGRITIVYKNPRWDYRYDHPIIVGNKQVPCRKFGNRPLVVSHFHKYVMSSYRQCFTQPFDKGIIGQFITFNSSLERPSPITGMAFHI
jgi:hypothetical protein